MSVNTGHFSQRQRRRLAWAILPALLLRALIPAGFMPLAGAGGPYLGFCPGAGPLPPGLSASAEHGSQLAHASHPGHAHHEDGGPGRPDSSHHYLACVFSTGATAGLAAMPAAALAPDAPLAFCERFTAGIFLPAILRTQSPRGPPILV
jgi:hypothetical protein